MWHLSIASQQCVVQHGVMNRAVKIIMTHETDGNLNNNLKLHTILSMSAECS